MDIIQSMRLSRMRIVLIAMVLAVAGLLVSASQIAPAGAAITAASGGGPKPTIVTHRAVPAGRCRPAPLPARPGR